MKRSSYTLAMDPDAHPAALAQLAGRRNPGRLRAIVAANPGLPDRNVRRLSRSWSWYNRAGVARNPNTPPDVVARLAKDRKWAVRHDAATSPSLPAESAIKLANDIAPVRLQLAANPRTPSAVAQQLLTDDDEWVRGTASGLTPLEADELRGLVAGMQQPAWMLRRIASNPSCPAELVDEIETWLVLGGGEGDTNFDPVTCVGHPGGEGHETTVYQEMADGRSVDDLHPLALARSRQVVQERGRARRSRKLLADPDPRVRRALVQSKPTLTENTAAYVRAHDPDMAVRQAIKASGQSKTALPYLVAWAVAIAAFLILGPLLFGSDDAATQVSETTSAAQGRPDTEPPSPIPLFGTQEVATRRGAQISVSVAQPPAIEIAAGDDPVTLRSATWFLVEHRDLEMNASLPLTVDANTTFKTELIPASFPITQIILVIDEGSGDQTVVIELTIPIIDGSSGSRLRPPAITTSTSTVISSTSTFVSTSGSQP